MKNKKLRESVYLFIITIIAMCIGAYQHSLIMVVGTGIIGIMSMQLDIIKAINDKS